MGQPSIYHATVALSFQIEICNLDRTKSSFLATSLYKKVIFTKNWVTRSCRPSDYALFKFFIHVDSKNIHVTKDGIQGPMTCFKKIPIISLWNFFCNQYQNTDCMCFFETFNCRASSIVFLKSLKLAINCMLFPV